MSDLRRTDFYLNKKEQEDWDKRNILYNTIWFYLNKQGKMPDIEYSDSAIKIYKNISYYQSWEITYHPYGGKNILPPNVDHFNADIMTGWFNPFKHLVGLNSRKEINIDFLNEIPSEKNSNLIEWFKKKNSKINKICIKSFLRFLGLIYTAGNIIPAPINWKSGSSLDGWDYKFKIIVSDNNNAQGLIWKDYINNSYIGNDFKEKANHFIVANHLEMYIDNDKIISFWDPEQIINYHNISPSQWTIYFKTVSKCIEERTQKITQK